MLREIIQFGLNKQMLWLNLFIVDTNFYKRLEICLNESFSIKVSEKVPQ